MQVLEKHLQAFIYALANFYANSSSYKHAKCVTRFPHCDLNCLRKIKLFLSYVFAAGHDKPWRLIFHFRPPQPRKGQWKFLFWHNDEHLYIQKNDNLRYHRSGKMAFLWDANAQRTRRKHMTTEILWRRRVPDGTVTLYPRLVQLSFVPVIVISLLWAYLWKVYRYSTSGITSVAAGRQPPYWNMVRRG